MTDSSADRFRFRVYVAGRVLYEAWTTDDDDPRPVGAFAVRQRAIAEAADREGLLWLVEVFDAEAPSTEMAYVRFGTDTAGMVDPNITVQPGECLSDALADHPFFKVSE